VRRVRPKKLASIVLLAGTIPQDSTRAALVKTLRKRWTDGPSFLEKAGFPERVITDPGLLVIVKMFPRKRAQDRAPAAAKVRRGGTPRAAPAASKASDAKSAAETKKKAKRIGGTSRPSWSPPWCGRFQAAAAARTRRKWTRAAAATAC